MKRIFAVIIGLIILASLTTAQVPYSYKDIKLSMTKEQVEDILTLLWPNGSWSEGDDSQFCWSDGTSNYSPFEGWFDKEDNLHACKFMLEDYGCMDRNSARNSAQKLIKTFGLPIQYDFYDEDKFLITWANEQTMICAETSDEHWIVELWICKRKVEQAQVSLPTSLGDITLGMDKKEALAAANNVFPGVSLQSGRNDLKDNGLRERFYASFGDGSLLILSFARGKLAEVILSPIELTREKTLENPESKYGKPLNSSPYCDWEIWFDGNVVMTKSPGFLRLTSAQLYQIGMEDNFSAGPDWNTSVLEADRNQNGAIAKEELVKIPAEKQLKTALTVNPLSIQGSLKSYIGKLVRFEGKITKVTVYHPGSPGSHLLNDGRYTVVAFVRGGPKGTVPFHVIILGDCGEFFKGDSVSVVGYPVGTLEQNSETGKNAKYILIVSNVVMKK